MLPIKIFWNADLLVLILGISWITVSSAYQFGDSQWNYNSADFPTWDLSENSNQYKSADDSNQLESVAEGKDEEPVYYDSLHGNIPSISVDTLNKGLQYYKEFTPKPLVSPQPSNELNSNDSSDREDRDQWLSSLRLKNNQTSIPRKKLDKFKRVMMGVVDPSCDDAKTNLTWDWDLSPQNYTCFHPAIRFPRSFDLGPLQECETIPKRYIPKHKCMNERIHYQDAVPTHGDHRPLWPMFGEYVFVPRERWLHNVEHGAVVMLYHPCAYPSEVNRLRTLVTGCAGKHVITPSTLLSPERPLAVVAWGCRLLLSRVDDDVVINFIETRAHRGVEGSFPDEGQYDLMLIRSANTTGNGLIYGYAKVTCSEIDWSRL